MLIPPPHGLFLGKAARSISVTSTPARARVLAAVAPAGPAPTTTTGAAGVNNDSGKPTVRGDWAVDMGGTMLAQGQVRRPGAPGRRLKFCLLSVSLTKS